MDVTVALVQARPETILDDHARLLWLAGLADDSEGTSGVAAPSTPGLLIAPPSGGPTPAGDVTPWQLLAVARALANAEAGLSAVWPAGQDPHPDVARALAAAGDARGGARDGLDGTPHVVLAGLSTHGRLGVRSVLAAVCAQLAPAAPPGRLVRKPAALQAVMRRLAPGTLAGGVVDATVCGDGREAAVAEPLAANLLLASRDVVALEVVACRLLGIAPATAPLVRAAAAAGWGTDDPVRIDVVGDVAPRPPRIDARVAPGPLAGWLGDDLPPALRRAWNAWWRHGPPGRARRRRWQSLPWARLRRDWRAGPASERGET
jgi:hypothetical protein